MRIAGVYSFKGGKGVIEAQFAAELEEIKEVIAAVDGTKHKTKVSKEKTMPGRILYKPGSMNKALSENSVSEAGKTTKFRANIQPSFIPQIMKRLKLLVARFERSILLKTE